MSLDFYLVSKTPKLEKHSGIFVRIDGQTKEVLDKETFDKLFPNSDQEFTLHEEENGELFAGNLTHNLCSMAEQIKLNFNGQKVTLYDVLWHPETLPIYTAYGLNSILFVYNDVINIINSNKQELSLYNTWIQDSSKPDGGYYWGTVDNLLDFLTDLKGKVELDPEAVVEVSI